MQKQQVMRAKMIKRILVWLFSRNIRWKKSKNPLKNIKLGITQDEEDERDHYIESSNAVLPISIDYSDFCPPAKHQGSIGSCGSHAIITGIETLEEMKNLKSHPLSEMYHYYLVRGSLYEANFPKDLGQHGRNAMKVAYKIGAVPEQVCPYKIANMNDGPETPIFAKGLARFWKINEYERCFSLAAIKLALYDEKMVWLGVPIQNAIFTYKRGIINYLKSKPQDSAHAMLVVGFDDDKKAIRIINSWGTNWGDHGFGWISYGYFKNIKWFDAWAFSIRDRL